MSNRSLVRVASDDADETSGLLSRASWTDRDPSGTPSYRATFSVVSTVAGAVRTPSNSTTRWIGIVILVLTSLMANYTGKLLIQSMYARKNERKLRTYHDVGEAAFGKVGLYLTLAMQNLTLISVGILFLILAGLNLQTLFQDWGVSQPFELFVGGTAVVVVPFIVILKTMAEISWAAVFGMCATTATVIVTVVYSVIQKDSGVDHQVLNAKQFPFAFSAFVFAFGGHNVFPAIQDSMRTKRNFNRMLDCAFLIILALYIPPAIAGYYAFGSNTKSVILDNLSGIVPQLARMAIIMHLWITLPLVNNPVNLWLEDLLQINQRFKGYQEFFFRSITRTVLFAVQVVIAIALGQYFLYVMAFIGASVVSGTTFFFPCFFYLKLYWKNVTYQTIALIITVLLGATLGSTIGMYEAVLAIIDVSPPDYVFYVVLGVTSFIGVGLVLLGIFLISLYSRNSTSAINF